MVELGDFDGYVPLDSLKSHIWIYESPYYRELLEKERLTDPTPMEYTGPGITIVNACVDQAALPCILLETYFAPNLLERTRGRVEFIVRPLRQLGLAGHETLDLLHDGILDSATVYDGKGPRRIPAADIQNLWGIHASPEQLFNATQAIVADLDELILAETGGAVLNHSWDTGNDQFIFCRKKIESLEELQGKSIRGSNHAQSDWLNGMNATPVALASAEVFTAIERGIVDCGITSGEAAHKEGWYEYTKYMMGPLFSFPSYSNVISQDKWASIPEDLQQIIIEEGAKSELEALRLAAIQSEIGLIKNQLEGVEHVPFSEEIRSHSFNIAAMQHVVPAWVDRVGITGRPIIADSFNSKVGPIVGLRIERDGTVVRTR